MIKMGLWCAGLAAFPRRQTTAKLLCMWGSQGNWGVHGQRGGAEGGETNQALFLGKEFSLDTLSAK